MDRLVIVPDEKLEPLALSLRSRLLAIAQGVRAENLDDLIGEHARRVLISAVRRPTTQEVLVWGPAQKAYVVGWSSLAPEREVVGQATASAEEGLVNRVSVSGQSDLGSGADLHAGTWTNLEERRGRIIGGMVASPVFLFGKCAVVVTLVNYRTDAAPTELGHDDAVELAGGSSIFGRLVEDRLIRACLGIETL